MYKGVLLIFDPGFIRDLEKVISITWKYDMAGYMENCFSVGTLHAGQTASKTENILRCTPVTQDLPKSPLALNADRNLLNLSD